MPSTRVMRCQILPPNLDGLLQNKTTLRDAVVVPEAVSDDEMMGALGIVD